MHDALVTVGLIVMLIAAVSVLGVIVIGRWFAPVTDPVRDLDDALIDPPPVDLVEATQFVLALAADDQLVAVLEEETDHG